MVAWDDMSHLTKSVWTAEKEWQEIVEIKGLVTDCQPHRSSRVSTAAVDRDLMPGDAEGIWRFGSRGR